TDARRRHNAGQPQCGGGKEFDCLFHEWLPFNAIRIVFRSFHDNTSSFNFIIAYFRNNAHVSDRSSRQTNWRRQRTEALVLCQSLGNSGRPFSTRHPITAAGAFVVAWLRTVPSLAKSLRLVPGSNGAMLCPVACSAAARLKRLPCSLACHAIAPSW